MGLEMLTQNGHSWRDPESSRKTEVRKVLNDDVADEVASEHPEEELSDLENCAEEKWNAWWRKKLGT